MSPASPPSHTSRKPVPSRRKRQSNSSLVVDIKHGPGGIAEALSCIHALDIARISAILCHPRPSSAQPGTVCALELLHPKAFGSPISPKASSRGMLSSEVFLDALQQHGAKADLFLYEGKTHTDLLLQLARGSGETARWTSLSTSDLILIGPYILCSTALLDLANKSKPR